MKPRRIDQPECGHWMLRLVKNGPLVPAAIMRVHTTRHPETDEPMERSPFLAAFIAGRPAAIDDVWLYRGQPITEAEYRFRVADLEWAVEHAPHEPIANPRRPVDLATMAPPF